MSSLSLGELDVAGTSIQEADRNADGDRCIGRRIWADLGSYFIHRNNLFFVFREIRGT